MKEHLWSKIKVNPNAFAQLANVPSVRAPVRKSQNMAYSKTVKSK